MLPILLKLGPITIYSYGVFLALGLFAGLYWFWKMGRDEHWDETRIFDIYFVAIMVYFGVGRVGYVLFNPELQSFGMAWSLLTHPGISVVGGVGATILSTLLLARRAGWEGWKVMDAWAVVILIVAVIGGIGAILNGSMPGVVSNNWGYVHPGDTTPRLSGDLWTFGWALLSFGIVSRVRKNFRFYSWYKGEASVARDGLASLTLGGLFGVYAMVAGFLLEGGRVGVIPHMSIVGLVVSLISAGMIFLRSGRYKKKG